MDLFEPQAYPHETRHIHIKDLADLGTLGNSILAFLGSTFTGTICSHGSDEGQPWAAIQAKDTMEGFGREECHNLDGNK